MNKSYDFIMGGSKFSNLFDMLTQFLPGEYSDDFLRAIFKDKIKISADGTEELEICTTVE